MLWMKKQLSRSSNFHCDALNEKVWSLGDEIGTFHLDDVDETLCFCSYTAAYFLVDVFIVMNLLTFKENDFLVMCLLCVSKLFR